MKSVFKLPFNWQTNAKLYAWHLLLIFNDTVPCEIEQRVIAIQDAVEKGWLEMSREDRHKSVGIIIKFLTNVKDTALSKL